MSPAQTVPLRYLARLDPGKSEVKHLPDDLEVDFIPMEAVGHGGRLHPTETRPLGEVRDGYTYLRPGDVTFAKISPSFQNRKGGRAQGLTNRLAFATTELTILRPEPTTDARFLQYVIESEPFIQHGAATLHGVAGQQRVDLSRVAAFPVWSPDIGTQRRIADMLDAETARIDTLIEKNERVLASLAARIEALRAKLLWPSHCVQAWSGDPLSAPTSRIPEVTRLQYVVPTRVAGGTPTSNNDSYWTEAPDRGVAWFAIGDLRHGTVSAEPSRRVSEEGMAAGGLSVVPAGTVVYAMYASVGKTSRLLVDGVTNQAILSLIPGESVLPEYLLEWLIFTQPFAEARVRSNTQGNLNADQVARFSVRVPSITVQRSITSELAEAASQVAAIRAKVDRQQELLRLRRQALITAAVTGQIEV